MEIINCVDNMPKKKQPLFLALGNFDGVHRGHQKIIRAAIQRARKKNGISAVLIFDPHPQIALRPEQPLSLLTDLVDRAEIMEELGLDYMIVQQFTARMAALSPEHFIRQVLIERLQVEGVFVGEDYSFGRMGAGSSSTLRYWGDKLGFTVKVSPMLYYKNKEVSSSIVRSLLLSGDVNEAADLLGYYFYRQGQVIKGYGVGKKMVYPTANIAASPRLLWPGKGVYLTGVSKLNGQMFCGVTNVGSRPTFADHNITVETHIIDFDQTIYNRQIRLCFLEKLRDTRIFNSAQQLKEQIGRDIEQSRELIGQYSQGTSGISHSLQAGCSMLKSQ
ncbi:MAG: bifunctional riboflavin kinase/FAD synthetase [Bacillota bacterium]